MKITKDYGDLPSTFESDTEMKIADDLLDLAVKIDEIEGGVSSNKIIENPALALYKLKTLTLLGKGS